MKFQLSTALAVGALLIAVQVHAGCRLPTPDGSENYRPSKESIFGDIERVELPNVFVRNRKTKQLEQISVGKIDAIYSVYGGDGAVEALKPGLQVWIWFENCKRPKSGPIYAAYLEFFSMNPKDRAKLNRSGKIVSVPPG